MSDPVDRLSAAYAALAEIRRRLEAGEVNPAELEQTLASTRAAFEEGQSVSVINRNFELRGTAASSGVGSIYSSDAPV